MAKDESHIGRRNYRRKSRQNSKYALHNAGMRHKSFPATRLGAADHASDDDIAHYRSMRDGQPQHSEERRAHEYQGRPEGAGIARSGLDES